MNKVKLSAALILFLFSSCNKSEIKPEYSSIECEGTLEMIAENRPMTILEGPFWSYFQNAQLTQLVNLMLEQNKTLQEMEATISSIHDESKKIRSDYLPQSQLNFFDNYQYYSKNGFLTTITPNFKPSWNDFNLNVGFTWNFDLFSKIRYMEKATVDQAISSFYKRKAKALELSSSLCKSFYNTLIFNEFLNISSFELEVIELKKNNILSLVENNLLSQQEVLSVEIEENKLKDEIAYFNQALILEKTVLSALIAKMPDLSLVDLNQIIPKDLPLLTLKDLKLDAILARPDVQMASYLVKMSENKIKSAKAAFYPNLNLQALAGLESVLFPKLFLANSLGYSATPLLELPLFNSGKLSSNLKKERHLYEAMIHSYDQTLILSAKEIVDHTSAYINYQKAFSLSSSNTEFELQKDYLKKSNFDAGLINLIEVLDQNIKTYRQKKDNLIAQSLFISGFIDMATSLGGGL